MRTASTSIAVTTVLSVLFHGGVIIALMYTAEKVVNTNAVGSGVSIELVSANEVANHDETDAPENRPSDTKRQADRIQHVSTVFDKVETPGIGSGINMRQVSSHNVITAERSTTVVSLAEKQQVSVIDPDERSASEKKNIKRSSDRVFDKKNQSVIIRSTDASQQEHNILELLHTSISDKKEYPYLARRQRREGISTVAFILHPDGRIEGSQLLVSSNSALLDRAAVSAVQDIEPFEAAPEYLERAQQFQVDVVFSLL